MTEQSTAKKSETKEACRVIPPLVQPSPTVGDDTPPILAEPTVKKEGRVAENPSAHGEKVTVCASPAMLQSAETSPSSTHRQITNKPLFLSETGGGNKVTLVAMPSPSPPPSRGSSKLSTSSDVPISPTGSRQRAPQPIAQPQYSGGYQQYGGMLGAPGTLWYPPGYIVPEGAWMVPPSSDGYDDGGMPLQMRGQKPATLLETFPTYGSQQHPGGGVLKTQRASRRRRGSGYDNDSEDDEEVDRDDEEYYYATGRNDFPRKESGSCRKDLASIARSVESLVDAMRDVRDALRLLLGVEEFHGIEVPASQRIRALTQLETLKHSLRFEEDIPAGRRDEQQTCNGSPKVSAAPDHDKPSSAEDARKEDASKHVFIPPLIPIEEKPSIPKLPSPRKPADVPSAAREKEEEKTPVSKEPPTITMDEPFPHLNWADEVEAEDEKRRNAKVKEEEEEEENLVLRPHYGSLTVTGISMVKPLAEQTVGKKPTVGAARRGSGGDFYRHKFDDSTTSSRKQHERGSPQRPAARGNIELGNFPAEYYCRNKFDCDATDETGGQQQRQRGRIPTPNGRNPAEPQQLPWGAPMTDFDPATNETDLAFVKSVVDLMFASDPATFKSVAKAVMTNNSATTASTPKTTDDIFALRGLRYVFMWMVCVGIIDTSLSGDVWTLAIASSNDIVVRRPPPPPAETAPLDGK